MNLTDDPCFLELPFYSEGKSPSPVGVWFNKLHFTLFLVKKKMNGSYSVFISVS